MSRAVDSSFGALAPSGHSLHSGHSGHSGMWGHSVFMAPALPVERGDCPVLAGMTPFGRHLPTGLMRHRRAAALLSLALLLAAVALLGFSGAAVSRAGRSLAAAQARLDEAVQFEAQALAQAGQDKLAATLAQQAQATGLAAKDWDERRFNMRQAVMSREAVNALMGEIARGPGRLFAADQFEVSVKRPDDGLFSRPREGDAEVLVTLRGQLVFRPHHAGRGQP